MRNNVARTIFITIFGLLLPSLIYGQTNQTPPTSADENFQLNVTESRVTETKYERSTSVEFSSDANKNRVFIRVGATASAEKIDIVLRGVTGNVRFRASLDALRKRIAPINQPNPNPDSSNR